MDNNMNKCPGCSHHCDLNNLQCGKGEAILRGEEVSSHSHEHKEGRHGGKHHGHRRPEFPEGSLADLMSKCGHRLFHGGDEGIFDVLSAQEQNALRDILTKLLHN